LVLEHKDLHFHFIKALYVEDEDFRMALEDPLPLFLSHYKMAFFFKGNKLCIPKSPRRHLIVNKAHGRASVGHFGINKTLEILKEHFYWPRLVAMSKVITRCTTCLMAKITLIKVFTILFRFFQGLGMTLARISL